MSASRRGLWRQGRERLSAWLPVLIMAFFALGSWWLVRSAPQFAPVDAPRPLTHDPDYEMRDFSVRSFDAQGQLTSEVEGTQALHFPDTDTLEVEAPRMRSYDEHGIPTVGSARRGVSNSDGSEVRLYGDARIIRDAVTNAAGRELPRMEFSGEYLDAFPKLERFTSDQPVTLTRGRDQFSGDVFAYDHKSGVAELHGNVRGLIQPATGQD